jgi:hypothetical protein
MCAITIRTLSVNARLKQAGDGASEDAPGSIVMAQATGITLRDKALKASGAGADLRRPLFHECKTPGDVQA